MVVSIGKKPPLLSCAEVLEEYKHPELIHPATGKHIELDVYVSGLNLAFEYQGEQHYQAKHWVSDLVSQQQRDSEKQIACKKVGNQISRVGKCVCDGFRL